MGVSLFLTLLLKQSIDKLNFREVQERAHFKCKCKSMLPVLHMMQTCYSSAFSNLDFIKEREWCTLYQKSIFCPNLLCPSVCHLCTAKPIIVGCWNFELYDFVSKMWMWILDKKLSFAIVCNLKRRDCYVQNFLEFKEFEGDKLCDMRIKPNTWLNSSQPSLWKRTSLEFGGKCNLPLIPRLIEY